MKKIISIILTILIISTLFVGCSSNKPSKSSADIKCVRYTLPQSAVYEYEIKNKETGKKETRSYVIDLLNDRYDKNVWGNLYVDKACTEPMVIAKDLPKVMYKKIFTYVRDVENQIQIHKYTYVKTLYFEVEVIGESYMTKTAVYNTAKNVLLGYRCKLITEQDPICWFEYV